MYDLITHCSGKELSLQYRTDSLMLAHHTPDSIDSNTNKKWDFLGAVNYN